MDKVDYDIIVVGAGAAGLTASLYAARRGMKVLVVSKDMGGQAASAFVIENYPGVSSISGHDLMHRFFEQAKAVGVEFFWQEADKIEKDSDGFVISSANKTHRAAAVVLAFGLSPRNLGVDGEDKFIGKSIVHNIVGHDELFKGKDVVVVGGGNSAFLGARKIARIAKKVFLIHRRDVFRAESSLINEVKEFKNVEFVLSAKVKKVLGDKTFEALVVEQEGVERILYASAVYVAIGFQADTQWVKGCLKQNDNGEIITRADGSTSVPGLFAAGDVTSTRWKQVVICAGEGCSVGLCAAEYVSRKKGKKLSVVDWG